MFPVTKKFAWALGQLGIIYIGPLSETDAVCPHYQRNSFELPTNLPMSVLGNSFFVLFCKYTPQIVTYPSYTHIPKILMT